MATATNTDGYLQLIAWARSFGYLRRAGVEGTGTYGAGLARVLCEQGVEVLEVNRPDRSNRRLKGKSNPTDAESAARSVLSDQATAVPKSHSGVAEAMRTLFVARRSAVKAETQAINQLRAILVSAPQEIRDCLWKTKAEQCVAACIHLRPLGTTTLLGTLTSTLRLLAKRWQMLAAELKELDAQLEQLTSQFTPRLREQSGVGPLTAATLIISAGDNPERLRSEAALAALCGVNPLQHGTGTVQWYDPEVTPCLIPLKYRAWHYLTMPDLARPDNKKAPEIRGFRHVKCLGLPDTAELEIIPTRSSPAVSPKYHKRRD